MLTLVVLVTLVVLSILVFPRLIVPSPAKSDLRQLSPVDRLGALNDAAETRNDVRTTLIQALGGALVLLTAAAALLQVRATRQGQVTDRFTKSVEQLGSTDTDVRLGGIYALHQIAVLPDFRRPIAEIYAAYLRTHASVDARKRAGVNVPDLIAAPVASDLDAVLRLLIARDFWAETDTARLNLSYLVIPNAVLANARLPGCILRGANLTAAQLDGTDLTRSDISDADLSYASLRSATCVNVDLTRTTLTGADLSGATFAEALLQKANLSNASLRDIIAPRITAAEACFDRCRLNSATLTGGRLVSASMVGAVLARAELTETEFRDAKLSDADLMGAVCKGADFTDATLTRANLSGADLSDASLRGARLDRVQLQDARVSADTDFSDAVMDDVTRQEVMHLQAAGTVAS
jgi:uncharacterized protein YjbI with pentapeptide repeats